MNLQFTIAFAVLCFALGACVGSFLNVVIWRLPHRGREVIFQQKHGALTLSWPPSHCPVCDAPIRWYQNIPVASWLVLRGLCANCRTAIPVRYPLVELGTGVLFAGFYLAYFVGQWRRGFDNPLVGVQGSALLLHLTFIAALLAASAIDIDLFIIPLSIPWFLIIVGVAATTAIDHPAIWKLSAQNHWWLARPIIGGTIGLIAANILLQLKVLPRSFASEDLLQRAESEESALPAQSKDQARGSDAKSPEAVRIQSAKAPAAVQREAGGLRQSTLQKGGKDEEPLAPPPKLTRYGASAAATAILLLLAGASWAACSARDASLITVIAGLLIFLIGVLPRDAGQTDVTDEVMEEISSPFVRREVMKEVPFLLIPALCAVAAHLVPLDLPTNLPWLQRLLGSLLGIMVGGGIVWLVRIGGTLGFNKEAMGMGDAHLMAAVGAVVGAPLVVIAFFMAPFIGIGWAIALLLMRRPHVLPYGPWLSMASILSLLLGNWLLALYFAFIF